MITFTGKCIDPFNLTPDDIDIRDIAHSLSMLCRFGGHTNRFYSVAEHSVRCRMECHEDKFIQQVVLLHDAAEAYTGDMIRPLKLNLPEFQELDKKIMTTIHRAFFGKRLSTMMGGFNDYIDKIDQLLLFREMVTLTVIDKSVIDNNAVPPGQFASLLVPDMGWPPEMAESMFLNSAHLLGTKKIK